FGTFDSREVAGQLLDNIVDMTAAELEIFQKVYYLLLILLHLVFQLEFLFRIYALSEKKRLHRFIFLVQTLHFIEDAYYPVFLGRFLFLADFFLYFADYLIEARTFSLELFSEAHYLFYAYGRLHDGIK